MNHTEECMQAYWDWRAEHGAWERAHNPAAPEPLEPECYCCENADELAMSS